MNKKGIIIGIASALVVVIAVVLILVLNKKTDAYRIIKVMSVSGKVTAARDAVGDLDAYEGMVLQSGDSLHVSGNSNMVMTMDEDKVAYVEENTQFQVIAEGTSASSKTSINVEYGAVNCEVRNKLSDDSSYEINTPNSTIAIRGTDVRVGVMPCSAANTEEILSANNLSPDALNKLKGEVRFLVRVSTFDGEIEITCKDGNGNPVGGSVSLSEGKELYIGGNDQDSVVLGKEQKIDLSTMPQNAISNIQNIKSTSGKCVLGEGDIEAALLEKDNTEYEISFTYNGTLFGTAKVKSGSTISEPTLKPTLNGSWDTDFGTPVTSDAEIKWIDK